LAGLLSRRSRILAGEYVEGRQHGNKDRIPTFTGTIMTEEATNLSTTEDGPVRVQLRRTKGWRMPPNTVKVDRSTPYGNPMPVGWMEQEVTFCGIDCLSARVMVDARTAVDIFAFWMSGENLDRMPLERPDLTPLRGKNLACWCPLDKPCHADVLLELANAPTAASLRAMALDGGIE
jgi:hypothetical protein